MTFDWSNYLKLAELMYQKAYNDASDCFDKEAFYRCSISRAYYSVFCLARNYLADKKQITFYSDEHKKVHDYFLNMNRHELKTIGNQLKMLHQDRKTADYNNSFPSEAPPLKASKSIKLAKKVENTLSTLT